MENSFAAAWIGFGNAFAFQDESDQAMAAYRTAARLFPGLHLPLTGMGMEYHRMNNLLLAKEMFLQVCTLYFVSLGLELKGREGVLQRVANHVYQGVWGVQQTVNPVSGS